MKKNPDIEPGFEAFFAVTHQGPAQGGKAGGGEPPVLNVSNTQDNFKPQAAFFASIRTALFYKAQFCT
jgi:hypothetical protein